MATPRQALGVAVVAVVGLVISNNILSMDNPNGNAGTTRAPRDC